MANVTYQRQTGTFRGPTNAEFPPTNNLFLTDDAKRADVKVSDKALKSIAKAPPNLAIYKDDVLHPVLDHIMKLTLQAHSAYMGQWSLMQKKWEKSDEYYWMAMKDHRLSELTRAKVSAAVFHRVCRRLADGAYLATFTEEMPVKFFPDIGIFEPSDQKDQKAIVAEGLNRWALYCMRKTGFREKCRDSYHKVYKYANHIAYVPYDYQIEKRKTWKERDVNRRSKAADGTNVYVHEDTGEISLFPHPPVSEEHEYDHVTHDEVGFHPLPIENCFLDDQIEDLDRQSTFLWRSRITRSELWGEGQAGNFKNIDRITELQRYNQYDWESTVENRRRTDSGKVTTDSWNSEMYERWQCWLLLPKIKVKLNKKGEPTDLTWDQNGEPKRYVMELVGDLTQPNVVVKFSESPYWGNGIPFISAHSHEDDNGFYHRGLQELLEDNMIQEQTAKGQLMDNRTLQNFRPLVRLVGRVRNKDMRITHNTVFDVTTPDALSQLQIPDLTGNIQNTLTFLSNESEQIAQTPPFFLGEATGSRTSATEFAALRDQSSAPALNDIKNLNMQLAGGYMKKLKEYAPQFLDHDISVPRGTNGPDGQELVVMIRPENFNMDMNVQEVAVQEFENRSTMRQILLGLSQVVSNPVFAMAINPVGYLERLFKSFSSVFPNPEEIIRKDEQVMAMVKAYLEQIPSAGGSPGSQPPQSPQGGPSGLPSMPGVSPEAGNPVTGYSEGQLMSASAGATKGI